MKKYKSLFDSNYPITKPLLSIKIPFGGDIINDFKFPKQKDFYFSYKFSYKGVFQLEKSKENNSHSKISSFKDEYMLDGHHDEYEDFDETNEVFEGDFYIKFLYKIQLDNLSKSLNNKLEKFIENNGKESTFDEFFKSINENWIMPLHPEDSFQLLLKSLGLNENNFEIIYENIVTNLYGDIISWYQYSELFEEEFNILEEENLNKKLKKFKEVQSNFEVNNIENFFQEFYQLNKNNKKLSIDKFNEIAKKRNISPSIDLLKRYSDFESKKEYIKIYGSENIDNEDIDRFIRIRNLKNLSSYNKVDNSDDQFKIILAIIIFIIMILMVIFLLL
tara:strand:- start:414 stop:1412 length:999 start_codon:yes stop_codon:yes gene_type:complete